MNNKLEKVTAVLVGCGSISKEWFDTCGYFPLNGGSRRCRNKKTVELSSINIMRLEEKGEGYALSGFGVKFKEAGFAKVDIAPWGGLGFSFQYLSNSQK